MRDGKREERNMICIPEIGASIWTNIVKPGYIVETTAGERIEVQIVREGYDTITLDNGWGRSVTRSTTPTG